MFNFIISDDVESHGAFMRLLDICRINAFETEDLRVVSDGMKPLTGLWLLPSYFNHSCLS